MAVKAEDVVAACLELVGANYRWWYEGASLPMWADDGYGWRGYDDCPPKSHVMQTGVMCADLIDWGRQMCGLPAVGGTLAWSNFITGWDYFDPNAPGQVGAICVKPYAAGWAQGHVAIYKDEHYLVQSINYPGVTEDYTDYEAYTWNQCDFTYYGFMPDVDYSGDTGGGTVDGEKIVLTPELLVKAMSSRSFDGPDLDIATARKYFPYLVAACKEYQITTRARLSAFLAQTGAESGSWQFMRELTQGNGRFGEFFGRGPIQMTWEENYQAFADATGYPVVSNPDLVASDPEIAFMSAGWFWDWRELNVLADKATWASFYGITGRIWGSEQAVPERDNRYQVAWDALPEGITLEEVIVPTPPPKPNRYNYLSVNKDGVAVFGGQDWTNGWIWINEKELAEGANAEMRYVPEFQGEEQVSPSVQPATPPRAETIRFSGEGETHTLAGEITIAPKEEK